MEAFEQELMRRSPLAAAVLESFDHVFDEQLLNSIWETHRGRCYEDVLTFGGLTHLMRDALIRYGGSGHKLFLHLEQRGIHPVNESSFYRKLANTPVAVSRALLREGAARLKQLMPAVAQEVAPCFEGFDLIVGDGKKIKDAAKRLLPTRGYQGSLIGAKALVAMEVRSGMAVAMNDSLDGLTNDVPLVPGLMEQLHQVYSGPILTIWDRQFDDVRTMRRFAGREGDAFVVRTRKQHVFVGESRVETTDAQGRQVVDEVGMLGRGTLRMRVRRITLARPEDEEPVVLLTNLLDGVRFTAADLLELYRKRWGIETVFQQVTETFSLTHLIGCAPRAILLQFSLCLLLYNQMQVMRTYVAEDGGVPSATVSMHYLFDDVRTELKAWAYHTDGRWERTHRDTASMRSRMRELLRGSWKSIKHTKASDRKPRGKPKPKLRLRGGHSSVQRVLEGRAKVVTK